MSRSSREPPDKTDPLNALVDSLVAAANAAGYTLLSADVIPTQSPPETASSQPQGRDVAQSETRQIQRPRLVILSEQQLQYYSAEQEQAQYRGDSPRSLRTSGHRSAPAFTTSPALPPPATLPSAIAQPVEFPSPAKRRRSDPTTSAPETFWDTVLASSSSQPAFLPRIRPLDKIQPVEQLQPGPADSTQQHLARTRASPTFGTGNRSSALDPDTFLRAAERVRPRLAASSAAFARSPGQMSAPDVQLRPPFPLPSPQTLAAAPHRGPGLPPPPPVPPPLPPISSRQHTGPFPSSRIPAPGHPALSRFEDPFQRSIHELPPVPSPAAAAAAATIPSPLSQSPMSGPSAEPPPFQCNQCLHRFRRKSDRNRHIRVVHEKQRPFVCPTCHSAFGEKSNMVKHIRMVHENIRMFQCPYCSATFGQRGNCDAHVRAVHEKNKAPRYSCPHCGLGFVKKNLLQEHVCGAGGGSYEAVDRGRPEDNGAGPSGIAPITSNEGSTPPRTLHLLHPPEGMRGIEGQHLPYSVEPSGQEYAQPLHHFQEEYPRPPEEQYATGMETEQAAHSRQMLSLPQQSELFQSLRATRELPQESTRDFAQDVTYSRVLTAAEHRAQSSLRSLGGTAALPSGALTGGSEDPSGPSIPVEYQGGRSRGILSAPGSRSAPSVPARAPARYRADFEEYLQGEPRFRQEPYQVQEQREHYAFMQHPTQQPGELSHHDEYARARRQGSQFAQSHHPDEAREQYLAGQHGEGQQLRYQPPAQQQPGLDGDQDAGDADERHRRQFGPIPMHPRGSSG
jgi:Zinc finger, C2H2 type